MPIHRSLGGTPSLLALLALGLTSHVQAQGSVFKSTVEVVPLTVTVTDARGKYLRNLVETDFAVLEEGVPQSLAFFANEPVPIDLALAIDASASMARQLPIVRKAAGALVDSLRGGDRATVVTINNAVGVALPLTIGSLANRRGHSRPLRVGGNGPVRWRVCRPERARTCAHGRDTKTCARIAVGRARYVQPTERRRHARAGAASRRRDLCHRHSDLVVRSPAQTATRIRVAGGVYDARPVARHRGPIVLPEEGRGAAGHLPRNRTRAREPVQARLPSVTVRHSRRVQACDSPRGKRRGPHTERVLCGSGFHRGHTARSVNHGDARQATLKG